MCHLAPYGSNVVKKIKTEMTEFFNNRKLAVDFLHFKVCDEPDITLLYCVFSSESCGEKL